MNYRVHVNSGIIHNLSDCCDQGRKIKRNNYHEVFTLAEAIQFAKSCGNSGHMCKHCERRQKQEEQYHEKNA